MAALLLPGVLLAVTAARQSRMMIVHVRDSSDGILEMFRSVAVTAGLSCHRVEGEKYPDVQCVPNADRNLGVIYAVDVTESRSVVVSAFSSNVTWPQGELDPAVEAALSGFRLALKGNSKVLRIDECAAPDYDGCTGN
jgi:hypothetical protein